MATSGIAQAEGPEQLYEGAPAVGRSSLEHNGQFGSTKQGERPHSLELFYGLTDQLALGMEVEAEAAGAELVVEELAVGAIVDLAGDEEAAAQLSLLIQAGVTTDGDLPQLETRLIGEHLAGKWRALGNLIVRHTEGDESGTSLGYAMLIEREIAEDLRFGLEASGQAARLSGFREGFESAHYAGPSVSFGYELDEERELELGLKYLKRLDAGHAYDESVRLAVEFEF